ncbi:hypothetical protein COEREDRAFT_6829 [Coemansia reversa NRRL 1564]|uniref:Uncharacterized protein n=1 Tax=Coemansia reversa (strain ATCC 12441 / NRRL 1564) TaxID=763665 RepID=A0A2G5BGG7_COERN|nr:hypothetical protein COEREDRAFT_6829 [Coemansia reversa NRRL 1564]|eukprot:PIA18093.1 hypothetical protein COEREDRAFT_6829 [Coemansia reversa NRRL 1564]
MIALELRSDDSGSAISLMPLFTFVDYSHSQSIPQNHKGRNSEIPLGFSSAVTATSNSAILPASAEPGNMSLLQLRMPAVRAETVITPEPIKAPSYLLQPKLDQMMPVTYTPQSSLHTYAKYETKIWTQRGIILFETTKTAADAISDATSSMETQTLESSYSSSISLSSSTSNESDTSSIIAYTPTSSSQSTSQSPTTATTTATTATSTSTSSAATPTTATLPSVTHNDTQETQSARGSQTHQLFQSVTISQQNKIQEKSTTSASSKSARTSATATSISTNTKDFHSQASNRLSNGYVVLITVATIFVIAVLLYFYMRRRKDLRARTNSTGNGGGGRTILSSHSGAPSVGADKSNKYNTAVNPSSCKMPPDSGASADYRNKHSKNPKDKYNFEKNTTLPSTDQQVRSQASDVSDQVERVMKAQNINYPIHHSRQMAPWKATGNSYERSAVVSTESDIYNSILTGKKQSIQFPDPQTAKDSHTALPARAVVKHSATSLDNVKPQPLSPVHTNDLTYLQMRSAHLVSVESQPKADQPLYSNRQPNQKCLQMSTGVGGRHALLETISANPGLAEITSKAPLGINVKPHKLMRDPIERPNSSKRKLRNHATVPMNWEALSTKSKDTRNALHTSSEDGLTYLGQQQQQQSLDKQSERITQPKLKSPPHTPNLDDLSQHKDPFNFITLLGSDGSLSDSYQL